MGLKLTLAALLLACISAIPAESQELGFRGWGVRAGLSADPDQLFVGVHLDLGEFSKSVVFRPNLEIGFGDDQTVYAINAAVHWLSPQRWDAWEPYLGGELGLNHRQIDRRSPFRDTDKTDLALNLVGGIEKEQRGGSRVSLEFKLGLIEDPRVKLLVGWTF